MELNALQWVVLAAGAVLVGLSKTGIVGVGMLTVALFAVVLPARESTGALLPLLICGDIVAVVAYRRHAVWLHLARLSIWVAAGVVAGFFAMGFLQGEESFQRLIGAILLAMVVVHAGRRSRLSGAAEPDDGPEGHGAWFAPVMGILAGFTTMVANAAGPVMVLYLLAMRLPKMEFLGTAAWFFLGVNLFKVPFSRQLGLITARSLMLDLKLSAAVFAGALAGRVLVRYINQRLFEALALIFSALAALRLVLAGLI